MPRSSAIKLLARREYSRRELQTKLRRQGFAPDAIEAVLDDLSAEGLQSDWRFAESYVYRRMARGYGPRRIQMELGQRGVDDALGHGLTDTEDIDWVACARDAWRKKFGRHPGDDTPDRARQVRFLEYRGFTHEQIRAVMDRRGSDDS